MSAEVLRRAAALMRERAEAATQGPWIGEYEDGDVWGPLNRERICRTSSHAYGRDAEHIASWHPAVALAVADELDAEAAMCEDFLIHEDETYLIAVARAYLGEGGDQ